LKKLWFDGKLKETLIDTTYFVFFTDIRQLIEEGEIEDELL